MLKKCLCLLLCAMLMISCALAEEDRSIFELMDDAAADNAVCADAEDQYAVAALYMLKMLEKAVLRLDSSLAADMDAFQQQVNADDARCVDSNQRVANRLYACADMLSLLVDHLDSTGTHRSEIDGARVQLSTPQSSSLEQQAAAADTIFALAAILATELDTADAWSAQIQTIVDDHTASLADCRGPQHLTANSLYRTVAMLSIAAAELDNHDRYHEGIGNVQDMLESLNETCTSSLHQCVNGAYRLLELFAIIALELGAA